MMRARAVRAGCMRGGEAGGTGSRQRQVMEESFVMLGSGSLLRASPAGLEASTPGLQPQSFDQKFATLAATFEIASDATKVHCLTPTTRGEYSLLLPPRWASCGCGQWDPCSHVTCRLRAR